MGHVVLARLTGCYNSNKSVAANMIPLESKSTNAAVIVTAAAVILASLLARFVNLVLSISYNP